MPLTTTRPTFLPLTVAAARRAAQARSGGDRATAAEVVWRRATEADLSAADCWAALLADCDSPDARRLPGKLSALTEAAARYAGQDWWRGDGSHLRRRLAEAQLRLVEAVRDADGQGFAGAFVSYDQAVATTVVAVQSRLDEPA
ncbi:MAG TPA: hypothetical protein VGD67_24365 [Pseudonocardiaceae bacterium]